MRKGVRVRSLKRLLVRQGELDRGYKGKNKIL